MAHLLDDAGRLERFRRVKPFAELLDRLLYTPQRNAKVALLVDYFRSVPDPDRGWGLAALTGALELRPRQAGADPRAGRDPDRSGPVRLVLRLRRRSRRDGGPDVAGARGRTALAACWTRWWRRWRPRARPSCRDWSRAGSTRWTPPAAGRCSKLVTGGLRVGASARLAKLALAEYGRQEPAEIEEVWHGLAPPYGALFAWLDGNGPRPAADEVPVFRPLMLAHPVEGEDVAKVVAELASYLAEWKWDGIRVQIAATSGGVRLYSRSGDDISNTFPDLVEAVAFQGVLDGELLVKRAGEVASFNELQQRLNRKAVTAADARGLPGLRASLRHPVRRPGRSARPAVRRRAASGSRRSSPASGRRAWTSRRWSRSPASTTSSACAAACAARRSRG